jgi:hypothetical protein
MAAKAIFVVIVIGTVSFVLVIVRLRARLSVFHLLLVGCLVSANIFSIYSFNKNHQPLFSAICIFLFSYLGIIYFPIFLFIFQFYFEKKKHLSEK